MTEHHEENLAPWWVVHGGIVLISFLIGGMFTAMAVLVYDGFVATHADVRSYNLADYLTHNALPFILGTLLTIGLAVYLDTKYGASIRRNL